MTNIERYKSIDKPRFSKSFLFLGVVSTLMIIGALFNNHQTLSDTDEGMVLQA